MSEANIIDLCIRGDVGGLEVWYQMTKDRNELKYDCMPLDFASWLGHTNVLEWWHKKSKKDPRMEMKYSDKAMYYASTKGFTHVLEWWLQSGLEIKYAAGCLNCAQHIDVLDWWFKSGIPLKFDESYILLHGRKDCIQWFKNHDMFKSGTVDEITNVHDNCQLDKIQYIEKNVTIDEIGDSLLDKIQNIEKIENLFI